MSCFLRLLSEDDKAQALLSVCAKIRKDISDRRVFELSPKSFDNIPGKPFSYWVNESVRQLFSTIPAFAGDDCSRVATKGLATTDDFRFLRTWWEIKDQKWVALAKGGAYSPYYADIHLSINWSNNGEELKNYLDHKIGEPGQWSRWINAIPYYLRPGLTWPNSSTLGLTVRTLPRGCVFSHMGCSVFFKNDSANDALVMLGIMNSQPFKILVSLLLGLEETRKHYEVGVIQRVPVPKICDEVSSQIKKLVSKAWSLKRKIESFKENSHAFLVPAALRVRLKEYYPTSIESELKLIQSKIDNLTFDLYGFGEDDRVFEGHSQCELIDGTTGAIVIDDGDFDESELPVDLSADLYSWAVGVAYGRFDYRLATGEISAPAEPDPFAPLPLKSPGMLSDNAVPFYVHAGILVEDQGHTHDLARLIEEVLARVEVPVPEDIRRWLQRDFFAFHLQRYSKSRRRAPIYWPLATTSGSYTLWIYYPSLTSQTLYTVINDFVEPKLNQVGTDVTALRNKGSARTRDDEKQFEALQAFELELIELRDTLLKLARNYKPNHDDGVQISAAPLWPLFRHKPWQKVLKDTWAKLEKGDYDWAHLAMNYWPERVREKCKTDKSLAIAHGLEDLYIEPEAKPKKARGKKKAGGDE